MTHDSHNPRRERMIFYIIGVIVVVILVLNWLL
jgi:hypothetical protein